MPAGLFRRQDLDLIVKNNVNIAEMLIEEGAGDLFLDDFETLLPADTNPKILAMECSRN